MRVVITIAQREPLVWRAIGLDGYVLFGMKLNTQINDGTANMDSRLAKRSSKPAATLKGAYSAGC